jgi:hypothetical protein
LKREYHIVAATSTEFCVKKLTSCDILFPFRNYVLVTAEAFLAECGGSRTHNLPCIQLAGAILLRELEQRTGIIRRFADCFVDHRDPDLIEHTVYELLLQRVGALALGYEDLIDHDTLRHDPLANHSTTFR